MSDESPTGKTDRNVEMTLRDGVILRVDVYRPAGAGPWPVLIQRTPYGKYRQDLTRYAEAGYIAVCVDLRGLHQSDGQWKSFARFDTHEAEDGYDVIEWAARLPDSTGKVGTFGASYDSWVQWKAASLRPASLAAMSAQTISARMTDHEGPGAMRPGKRLHWWWTKLSAELRRKANRPGFHDREEGERRWNEGEREKWLDFLPWLDLPQEVFEDETEPMKDWFRNPHTDPWKLDEDCRNIDVPNLDIVGWFDHANGDLRMFKSMVAQARSETARTKSQIVVGPWSHPGRGQRQFGNIDFGPKADWDLVAAELRWFDYWLKGKTNGVESDAQVHIFVMGDNQWRDEPAWPPKHTEPLELFPASNGNANTPAGDGRLLNESAAETEKDEFVYDPADPVPAMYGSVCISIPVDQRPLSDRQDILVYQTEPLNERIEVTGNPTCELFAASSAPDTDFFARLIDVAPDGLARDVSTGLVRARYRNGLDQPQLIEPGEVIKYTIRMGPTSNAFLPGHRIRLDITSSHFPAFDRNHNPAADQNADATLQIATNTVFHGGPTASKLILPCIRSNDC